MKRQKGKGWRNATNLDINRDKLESTLKKQWVQKAIDLMKEGYSSSYIREYLKANKTGSRSQAAIDNIMSEANMIIVDSQFVKAQEIIPLHIRRYNNIIKQLLATKDIPEDQVDGEKITWEDFYKARNKKIKAYSDCIDTAVQKETLLQFHRKDFKIEYNVTEKITIKETKEVHDTSKLTFDEKVELMNLMVLCKKMEYEVIGVIDNGTGISVTEDVEAEVVDAPSNMEGIKTEELEVKPHQIPITASDPTVRLRETLQKLAAKQFKEAGGTLTEDEQELIK